MLRYPINGETPNNYTQSLNPSKIIQILVHIPSPLWIPTFVGMTRGGMGS